MIKLNKNGLLVNVVKTASLKIVDKSQLDEITDEEATLPDSNGGNGSVNVPTEYQNHILIANENGNASFSDSIEIIAKEGTTEKNVIIHNHPDGILESPYIAIESATLTNEPGAALILKDDSQLARDTFGNVGGFELKAGESSLKGERDGSLTWCDDDLTKLVGEIKWYAGTTVPEGYLLCDGSMVSCDTYWRLFNVIGLTWMQDGDVGGSELFRLPDLIGRVAWGGATSGAYKEAGLPNINGSATFATGSTGNETSPLRGATGSLEATGDGKMLVASSSSGSSIFNTLKITASKSSEIYGNSTTVQPPAAVLMPIIKY